MSAPDRERDFGELRSLLHQAPTKDALHEVARLINGSPHDDPRHEWLPYVGNALERWYAESPRTWAYEKHGYWHAEDLFLVDHESFFEDVEQPSSRLYRALGCDIWLEGDAAIEVFLHPRLGQFDLLEFTDSQMTCGQLERLVSYPGVENVRALCLSLSALEPSALAMLGASAHLGRLETLDLSGNPIGAPELARLLEGRPSLRELNLSCDPGLGTDEIPPACVQVLCEHPGASRLTRLGLGNLSESGAAEAVISLVQQREHLAGLRHLHLSGLSWDVDEMWALCNAWQLESVETLHLSGNRMPEDVLEELMKNPNFSGVRHLDLSNCDIHDLRPLARHGSLASLETLDVRWNPLSEGLPKMNVSPKFERFIVSE